MENLTRDLSLRFARSFHLPREDFFETFFASFSVHKYQVTSFYNRNNILKLGGLITSAVLKNKSKEIFFTFYVGLQEYFSVIYKRSSFSSSLSLSRDFNLFKKKALIFPSFTKNRSHFLLPLKIFPSHIQVIPLPIWIISANKIFFLSLRPLVISSSSLALWNTKKKRKRVVFSLGFCFPRNLKRRFRFKRKAFFFSLKSKSMSLIFNILKKKKFKN